MKIKKIHKQMFDAIQFKRAEAQFKRATEILAVDPKDYRALSYVATRSCKQVNAIMSSAPTQRTKYGIGQFRDVVQYRFGVPMTLLRQAYSLRINTRENKATGNRGILPTCDLEGHELLNLVDAPNKRGRLYRRHEAWQNVIAWFLTQVGIGITGSPLGTPPTCKGTFRMAAAQATGWHTMSASEAETFRRENYIIADIIVFLENLIFRNIPDEDLPLSILRAIGKRLMLDAKTIQGQQRYFDNKDNEPAAVANKRQQAVKVGSRSYEARARKFDTKVPGATPFQDKLKEYVVMAPTVGMFGEISKDGESILEIAAWKRADEYCTFFDSKPSVALSRIKQQMHREVGHCNMLQIVRNIRDNMEILELPGGGSYQPSTGVRYTGGARAVELEDDLISFRDPGHRAGPGGFD